MPRCVTKKAGSQAVRKPAAVPESCQLSGAASASTMRNFPVSQRTAICYMSATPRHFELLASTAGGTLHTESAASSCKQLKLTSTHAHTAKAESHATKAACYAAQPALR
jgi:hypothetical protein